MKYKYPYFDAHCDTLTKLYKNNDSLNNSSYMVNISSLKKYSSMTEVFAIYNSGEFFKKDVSDILNYLKKECAAYPGFISFEKSIKGIVKNCMSGKITALASIENLGSQPDFSLKDISYYKSLGIIIIGLCHNDNNILCGGAGENNSGLTSLGKAALRQMQENGVILDVSHMSDKSFWEATAEYSLPFMATHSNSRAICPNVRNLTDEQFVYLAKRGGICGINFYPPFVSDENADVNAVIKHIEHFMSLGGEDAICIGSDFDGAEKMAKNLENTACVYRIFDKLLAINYNETVINKIAFNNFHNFLKKYETLS